MAPWSLREYSHTSISPSRGLKVFFMLALAIAMIWFSWKDGRERSDLAVISWEWVSAHERGLVVSGISACVAYSTRAQHSVLWLYCGFNVLIARAKNPRQYHTIQRSRDAEPQHPITRLNNGSTEPFGTCSEKFQISSCHSIQIMSLYAKNFNSEFRSFE